MLNAIKRFGSSAPLLAINATVAVMATGLVTLTVMEHYKDTPEIRNLACAIGLPRTDCPAYGARLNRLESEITSLQGEKGQIERRLFALSAIEHSVDEVTLFEKKKDPASGFEITIGTVYRNLTNATAKPKYHFCYIVLANGAAGESRNLYFQRPSGPVALPASLLAEASVTADVLEFGKSVCKPFLITTAS